MAAVATKKYNGDRGVQLTFPRNFAEAYDLPYEYFPSNQGRAFELMVGTHFQSQYHEEKRQEANQSVMNGLQARRSADQKLLTGPHNYHLPKPVLGQRKYANPSYGAEGGGTSTRRDNGQDAPFRTVEIGGELRGGVVRSLEGQNFYKKQLDNRIAQLNRINALSQGFAVEMGSQYKTEDNTKSGSVDKVEFFIYLRALMDAIVEGDLSRFTFENFKEMVVKMFNFGPTMTMEDIDDMRYALDNMIVNLRDGLSDNTQGVEEPNTNTLAYSESLLVYVQNMRKYIGEMERGFEMQPREKKTLSNSLRKSLKFERLLRKDSTPISVVQEARQTDTRVNQAVEGFDGGFDDDDDDDDGGDGQFDRPAQTREDDEAQGMPRAPFAGRNEDPNRGRFGARQGLVVWGANSFFGETEDARGDAIEDRFPTYVAPLGIAGSDPNAVSVPDASPEVLAEAVLSEVKQVLKTTSDEDLGELIATLYPDPKFFVNEVAAGLEEKNFSKAQIASGMQQCNIMVDDQDVFTDYIAENSGPTGPAPIAARSSGLVPMGGIGAPIFRDLDDDGQADAVPPAQMADAAGGPVAAPKRRKKPTAKKTTTSKEDVLRSVDWPTTRAEMYDNYTSKADYRELGLRLPAEFGGPYKMREGTTVKNAKAALIAKMKMFYSAAW